MPLSDRTFPDLRLVIRRASRSVSPWQAILQCHKVVPPPQLSVVVQERSILISGGFIPSLFFSFFDPSLRGPSPSVFPVRGPPPIETLFPPLSSGPFLDRCQSWAFFLPPGFSFRRTADSVPSEYSPLDLNHPRSFYLGLGFSVSAAFSRWVIFHCPFLTLSSSLLWISLLFSFHITANPLMLPLAVSGFFQSFLSASSSLLVRCWTVGPRSPSPGPFFTFSLGTPL